MAVLAACTRSCWRLWPDDFVPAWIPLVAAVDEVAPAGCANAGTGACRRMAVPELPASPKLAIALALDLVKNVAPANLTIIGSSLGGYYATWLAEQLGCRAVLLNPAIVPLIDLEQHVGVTTEFHSDKPFEFKREYIEQLRGFAVPK